MLRCSSCGGSGSRTERGALAVVRAEKRLERTLKWEAVFREMDRIYPEDSNEGFVASMISGNGLSQAELARIGGCSRSGLKRRRLGRQFIGANRRHFNFFCHFLPTSR